MTIILKNNLFKIQGKELNLNFEKKFDSKLNTLGKCNC